MTPSPFIRAFYGKTFIHSFTIKVLNKVIKLTDTGDHMLIDVDGKSKDEIYEHLIKVIGKSR